MSEYHKIQSIYKRDMESKRKLVYVALTRAKKEAALLKR